jgi:hypothetical protein
MVRKLSTDARETSYWILSSLLTAECSTIELTGEPHNNFVFILIQTSESSHFEWVQHRDFPEFLNEARGRFIFKDLDLELARQIHQHSAPHRILFFSIKMARRLRRGGSDERQSRLEKELIFIAPPSCNYSLSESDEVETLYVYIMWTRTP